MKTAVIYSGQARSFAQVFENHYWHVLRKLPHPEFFVSVAEDEEASSMHRLAERFSEDQIHCEFVQQPELPEPKPDPKWLPGYKPSATPQAILKQLWANHRAWQFFYEQRLAETYTLIVRIRPDIGFHDFQSPFARGNDSNILSEHVSLSPWWARWGGVNDRFALLGSIAAEAYFNTWNLLPTLQSQGAPLHPETLVRAALEYRGIRVSSTLGAEFCTVRKNGSFVPMDPQINDIVDYARTKL